MTDQPSAPYFGNCKMCGRPDPTDDCCDSPESVAANAASVVAPDALLTEARVWGHVDNVFGDLSLAVKEGQRFVRALLARCEQAEQDKADEIISHGITGKHVIELNRQLADLSARLKEAEKELRYRRYE